MSKENIIKKYIDSLSKRQKITAVTIFVLSGVVAVIFALLTVKLILN